MSDTGGNPGAPAVGDPGGVIVTFGYGSLVNRQTRDTDTKAHPGTLSGWIREWRIAGETPGGRSCTLTVRPDPGSRIWGVMVEQPAAGLAELDRREWRYDRHPLPSEAFQPVNGGSRLAGAAFVYRAKRRHYRWGDADHPILLSYVDVVLSGFEDVFGEAGVDHFVQTTRGWQVPILNDRAAPRYPRAQPLPPARRRRFDAALAAVGVRYI